VSWGRWKRKQEEKRTKQIDQKENMLLVKNKHELYPGATEENKKINRQNIDREIMLLVRTGTNCVLERWKKTKKTTI
jgi:hypothetical protein